MHFPLPDTKMRKTLRLLAYGVILLCMLPSTVDCYKAAVYEHDVIFPADRSRVVTRIEALKVMMKNLQVYSEQCHKASDQV